MSAPRIRMTDATIAVLEALAGEGNWQHGYALMTQTGLASGSLYPILIRLAERGYVEAAWEEPPGGRPPRHLYRLTVTGRELAHNQERSRRSEQPRRASRRATLTPRSAG